MSKNAQEKPGSPWRRRPQPNSPVGKGRRKWGGTGSLFGALARDARSRANRTRGARRGAWARRAWGPDGGWRTSGVVVDSGLREHSIALNLGFAQWRAVARDHDELGCGPRAIRAQSVGGSGVVDGDGGRRPHRVLTLRVRDAHWRGKGGGEADKAGAHIFFPSAAT